MPPFIIRTTKNEILLHKPNKVGVRSVNYKTLIKEMKGINKWKDKRHSWVGRFNIVKMSFLGEIPWQCTGSDSAFQCRDCRFDHGQGTKIPHISWPKSQNRKQNNTVTKSIKSLKMVHLKKNFPKKRKMSVLSKLFYWINTKNIWTSIYKKELQFMFHTIF